MPGAGLAGAETVAGFGTHTAYPRGLRVTRGVDGGGVYPRNVRKALSLMFRSPR